MLYTQSFVFNPFQENTYIIYNDKNQCWIVDPGMYNQDEINMLFAFIDEKKLLPQAIINTHTHIDHILGVAAVKDRYNISFGIHEKDIPVLNGAAGSAMLFGINFKGALGADFYIKEDVKFKIGDEELEILFVPGHSPGSIAFHYPAGKWVIAGDALFSGSIGRTDLPGGNHNQLITSIKTQLLTLAEDTNVYSGHGQPTTIGIEKKTNPFLIS